MKFLHHLTNRSKKKQNSPFADFFLHASEEEKKKVFIEAAKKANEDQRALIESVNKLSQKTT